MRILGRRYVDGMKLFSKSFNIYVTNDMLSCTHRKDLEYYIRRQIDSQILQEKCVLEQREHFVKDILRYVEFMDMGPQYYGENGIRDVLERLKLRLEGELSYIVSGKEENKKNNKEFIW